MFCGKCGKQISDEAAFCPYCGQKTAKPSEKKIVKPPESPQKEQQKTPQKEQQKTPQKEQQADRKTDGKKKTSAVTVALIVGAVLILLAAALIGYKLWSGFSEGPVWHDADDVEESEDEEEPEETTEDEEAGEDISEEPAEEEPAAFEEPEEEEEEEAEEEPASQYFLPTSNSEYLTMSDLEGFSQDDCRMARNELYARHGRRFDDVNLQAYFDACDWYEGTIAPEDFDDSVMNEYETANRDLIVEYEKKMGYR